MEYLLGIGYLHHTNELISNLRHQIDVDPSPRLQLHLDLLVRDFEVVQDYGIRPYLASLDRDDAVAVLASGLEPPLPRKTEEIIDDIERAGTKRRRRLSHEQAVARDEAARVKTRDNQLGEVVYPMVYAAAGLDYAQMLAATYLWLERVLAPDAPIHDVLVDKLGKLRPYILGEDTSVPDLAAISQLFAQYVTVATQVRRSMASEDVCVLRERGNNMMAVNAYPGAIQVYTEALAVARTHPEYRDFVAQLHTNRAVALIGLNCFSEAINDLNQAVSCDWSFTPAWAQLGYAHLYLGLATVGLRLYLCALKCCVGEIAPRELSDESVATYVELRLNQVMPQFIHRLCSAIALTERRALQQKEPPETIRQVVSDVRRILAKLRAEVAELDDERERCFTYTPMLRGGPAPGPQPARTLALRDTAERANRQRPTILTQEVSQDIMSGATVTGFDGFAVGTASPFDRIIRRENATTATSNTTATAPAPPTEPAAASAAATAAALAAALAATQVLGLGFGHNNRLSPRANVLTASPPTVGYSATTTGATTGPEATGTRDDDVPTPTLRARPTRLIRQFFNDFGEMVEERRSVATDDEGRGRPENVISDVIRGVFSQLGPPSSILILGNPREARARLEPHTERPSQLTHTPVHLTNTLGSATMASTPGRGSTTAPASTQSPAGGMWRHEEEDEQPDADVDMPGPDDLD